MTLNVNTLTGKFSVDTATVPGATCADDLNIIVTDFDSKNHELVGEFKLIDFEEQFYDKRDGLAAMVGETGEFRRDEIEDLVLTANKAVWQESKDAG